MSRRLDGGSNDAAGWPPGVPPDGGAGVDGAGAGRSAMSALERA
jgi:hypothetical protein